MTEALRPADVPRIYGDVPPLMAVPHAREVPPGTGAAILGMPYDGIATFRGGATRRGPQEIRKFSLLSGRYNFDLDLDVFEHLSAVDLGDVDVVPGDNSESYARFEARIETILAAGAVPVSLGGDHGISYPAVRAVARRHAGPMSLVVFDTHLDLSESFCGDRLTRASPLLRICELENVDPGRAVQHRRRGADLYRRAVRDSRGAPRAGPAGLARHPDLRDRGDDGGRPLGGDPGGSQGVSRHQRGDRHVARELRRHQHRQLRR